MHHPVSSQEATRKRGSLQVPQRLPMIGVPICLAFLALAGAGLAQDRPPLLNPPGLPPTPIDPNTGVFGPSLGNGLIPSFPVPNGTTWTPLGPAPLNQGGAASGRLAGVAVDPTNSNNIYVAAAGGGVWQSTDGGATYNPLTDQQNTLSMGAIAIAPSNHLKIYAGTGEANNSVDSNFGLGILVSNDGGATWSLSTGPSGVFNRLAVSKISVDPTNANTAYAALNDYAENGLCCANTGVYKTSDGGTTWTNVTAAVGLDATRPWSDVVVDPNTPSIIYAAHGDIFAANAANGVYRSLNGGSTWALLSGAPSGSGIGRIAIAVAPSASTAGSHVLYVAIAQQVASGNGSLFEMLVSNNADAATPTFTNLSATPNFAGGQGWYDLIIGVDPANSQIVYAAGVVPTAVIRSINGGTSWTNITTVSGVTPHTDSHAMAFDSAGRMLLGNDGGIWRYDPAGPSWSNLNGNLNTIQFTGIGIHPTNTQIVLGGSQDNGTELTTGSATWNVVDGGDGGYSQISQTNPLICYSNHPIASFGTNFFTVSTNGCNTFTRHTPAISNSNLFNFYAPIFVDPSNGNRVFLGGDQIYESTNAAASWTGHASPSATPINSIAVLPGGNTIYISAGGEFASSTVWVSINDGTSWTQHSLPVSGTVQEIDIDPNDSTGNTAVAVINNFGAANGQVYRTINGGIAWTKISANLPNLPVWSAKIDTDGYHTIYVSNETGVYSSQFPYSTWGVVGTGLPHAQGVHLELNSSLHELAVATHGRGAWYFMTPNVPLASPAIAKAFNPTTISSGGVSLVTLTLNNVFATTLTGAAFTDTLVNMSAVGGAAGGTCTGASSNVLGVNATSLSFTGITVPAASSCTVSFSVTSTNAGVNPNTTSGVTSNQTPTAGPVSNTANLTVTAPPTVVSYNVICGSACTFNMVTSSRTRLPWQITGIQVIFSQPITSADVNSLTGVSATGMSGLGTNTLTWTFAGVTNGNLATALATTGPHAITGANGALTGGNTSFALKILQSDFNDDGQVNSSDLTLVNNARSAAYNVFADINGDGIVNTTDVNIVHSQIGQTNH